MTSAEFITKWNARFPDNQVGEIEEADLREFAADIAETFGYVPPTATSLAWDENVTYNTATHSTDPRPYAEANDRLYRTKQDGNTGNPPPTAMDSEGIIQDAWWVEVSRAESSPIKEWTAGAYGSGLIIVLFNDKFYKLNVASRPFESENIETEIEDDQWVIIGGGSSDGGPAVAAKYATWALLLADQANQKSGFVYFAADASGFSTVDAGYAYFEYLGTTAGDESDYRKLTEAESMDLDLSGKVNKDGGDSQLIHVPEDSDNASGFFAGLLTLKTNTALLLKTALDQIVSFIKTDVFKVSDVDVSDISEGESKIPTVVKQNGVPVIAGAARKVDKLGPEILANILDDSQNWIDGVLEINAANPEISHPLGYNGLEFTYKRRWYLCKSHVYDDVTGYAEWEMNTIINMLNSSDAYDLSIITELENPAGWVDDLKTVSVASIKGDEWVQTSTGYSFKCINNSNQWFRIRSTYLNLITDNTLINELKALTNAQWGVGNVYNLSAGNQGDFFADEVEAHTYFCISTANHTWKRVGLPNKKFLYITDLSHPILAANLKAHDFTTGWYNDTSDLSNEGSVQGQKYKDTVAEELYENLGDNLWLKY